MKKNIDEHLKIISENTVDFISDKELAQKLKNCLKEKKPLKVKIGFDPTAEDIHLGHTVLLRKLRKIQDLGHIVYFIIGDFTAKIGDPSGRTSLRPPLSKKEIEDNAKTYTEQAFKILDRSKTKIISNSQWYKGMKLSEFISLLSHYTVARMTERDDFSKRLKENKPLSLQEFVYPIIQGYDSVMLASDIEFGGTDQKFNLIVGRHLQETFNQLPQVVITMPLLVGLDGKNKMSKSLENYVGITESPKTMFGKLMSISDELMWDYARLLTDLDIRKLKKMHPKEAKVSLAHHIVSMYHSRLQADKEKEEFQRVFSKRELPRELPTYSSKLKEIDIIETLFKAKLVASKNEARRLMSQNGITTEGRAITSPKIVIPAKGIVLKVGKRRFVKIVYSKD